MKTITRWIAELLFARELEEDYQMGLRYGQQFAKAQDRKILVNLNENTAKKNHPGIALALDSIR
jgi:hypothetical protein